MSAQHTSGPWLLADDGSAFVYAPNRPTDSRDWCNRFHARVDAGYDENDQRTQAAEMLANARLIASAPELLEALRRLEVAANTVAYCHDKHRGNFAAALSDMESEAEAARAAIAKATGGAS